MKLAGNNRLGVVCRGFIVWDLAGLFRVVDLLRGLLAKGERQGIRRPYKNVVLGLFVDRAILHRVGNIAHVNVQIHREEGATRSRRKLEEGP